MTNFHINIISHHHSGVNVCVCIYILSRFYTFTFILTTTFIFLNPIKQVTLQLDLLLIRISANKDKVLLEILDHFGIPYSEPELPNFKIDCRR